MMTLEQLKQHHAQIYRILEHEIKVRQTNGDKYTITLAQLEAAMSSLQAMKDDLKAGLVQQPSQPRLVDTREEYRYR